MKELVKAVRHDTLRAIDNGEMLLKALGEEGGKGTDKLRRGTKRLVYGTSADSAGDTFEDFGLREDYTQNVA
jgi:hypothetical protein